MKIVRMKKQKTVNKTDSFAVLCLIQSSAVIFVALSLFLLSRFAPSEFDAARDTIRSIFSDDLDIGGYFTDEKETLTDVSASDPVSVDVKKEDGVIFVNSVNDGEAGTAASENVFSYCYNSVCLPVSGTVTSEFGSREHPIFEEESFHSGKDIAAPEGTPIYAVLDGTVTQAGTAQMAGNYIRIDHGNQVETLYCHCSELLVSEGVNVR